MAWPTGLGLAVCCLAGTATAAAVSAASQAYCPVYYLGSQPGNCPKTLIPDTYFLGSSCSLSAEQIVATRPRADQDVFENVFNALEVLQREYYDANYGTWPSAIDWTAAVTQTVMTGTLSTFSRSIDSIPLRGSAQSWADKENLISSFFAQVVGSYFGQDILSIRGEAYDDILWVALGWIEAIKFVSTHSQIHYPSDKYRDHSAGQHGLGDFIRTLPWHGHNWISSFAHRSRVFWNLASRGWDTRLCHGGMVWNSRLLPYKNAITNQLWISTSIAMYRHFPGDNFTSPWLTSARFPEKDPAHLKAAVEGYRWLMGINMTNDQGLFVDGYHIDSGKPGNVECDVRDEMVYTYNQGVVLTGQRELWMATGATSYLEDGHRLVQNVMNATGWNLETNSPRDADPPPNRLPPWRGLGRLGVMEERCDSSGTCSQDGQTFKAIFFHHLSNFCRELDPPPAREHGFLVDRKQYGAATKAHAVACRSYLGWVRHNAMAAAGTRDASGRFGTWWFAGLIHDAEVPHYDTGYPTANATDYRNNGTPADDVWGRNRRWLPGLGNRAVAGGGAVDEAASSRYEQQYQKVYGDAEKVDIGWPRDPNNRGRGRTVETQVGGLAVLRAYWDLSHA
ncbi:Glycosyl hydrolase family 76 [Geosmithia morbida]|uniref:Glycosyl hydrolase family 76 n=1 Tax=Geosmithia morbida TaxID=1094350 RepID=A0A9P5D3I0_9HYPO|nr:Glycosyl hydrolase family 76 [Geosmithia morbida]KAF4124967.1 Glycosyl hydrolase family 76 [Geosmithia morbida]